jgi:ubiquinone/menaquinone biosynthesis C-methylase UbiE
MEPSIKNKIYDMLKNRHQGDEFEFRFGKFDKDFNPKIDLDSFLRLNDFIKSFSTLLKIEYSFIAYAGEHRLIQTMSSPIKGESLSYPWDSEPIKVQSIMKKNISKIDVKELGIRVSLSNESENIFPEIKEIPFLKSRKRISYRYENYIIEISMFKTGKDRIEMENCEYMYDIEVEVEGNDSINFDFLLEFIKVIQNTEHLLTVSHLDYIVKQYNSLIKSNKFKFIGIQPETIRNEKIINNEQYAATLKLDGLRCLLFILDNRVFSINSKLCIKDTGIIPLKNINLCILDAEYYKGTYHIFDIIVSNFTDIRDNKDFTLKTRIDLFNIIVQDIGSNKIVSKDYHIGNNYLVSKSLIEKYFYKSDTGIYDGIIYVPVNRAYPSKKNSNIPLKWKPSNQLTIDFKIKKVDNVEINSKTYETWQLYTKTSNNTDSLFQYNDYPLDMLSRVYIPTEIGSSYTDLSVVEFYYDIYSEQFRPIRSRLDKQHGNFIDIAKDNFECILNPFDYEYFNMVTKPREKTFFYNMRRYHNWIKSIILDKYSNRTHSLLDLACGKGGDIHKWVNNNIKTVTGIDINNDSINEAIRRSDKIKSNPVSKNFDISFECLDLSKDLYSTDTMYDTVTCFFAMHYFFKDQDSLTNFMFNTVNLKVGGHFIMAAFDDIQLKNIDYTLNNSKVKIENLGENDSVFGKSINVWIKDTVLNKPEIEYVINTEFLINYMRQCGFELVENIPFQDLYNDWTINKNNMNYIQKQLSFLNKGMVFKKIKKTTNFNIAPQETEVKTENVCVFTRVTLSSKKITELKSICIELKLKHTGKKSELVDRILQHNQ